MLRTLKLVPLLLAAMAVAGIAATTGANLQTAYNRELNTKAVYSAFAAKADAEGYPGAAGVFRAVAFSESIHAANHAKVLESLGGRPLESMETPVVNGTKENLKAALKLELKESGKIYPPFVKQAIKEGNAQAIISLKGAMASENGHARIFSRMIENIGEWKTKITVIVCRTCGYASEDLNLKVCPFCMHPREEFAEL